MDCPVPALPISRYINANLRNNNNIYNRSTDSMHIGAGIVSLPLAEPQEANVYSLLANDAKTGKLIPNQRAQIFKS